MPELNDLSEREREILSLIAQGASNKEIAQALTISANTVKVHLRNIFGKIQVSSRTEAAMFAVNAGLVGTSRSQAENGREAAVPIQPVAETVITRSDRRPVVAAGLLLLVVFVLGGFLWRSRGLQVASAAPTPPPRWQELASLPTPRSGLAVVAFENRVYAIAGESLDGVSGQVEYFDPQTNRWTAGAPKPLPVAGLSAAVIGGKFYLPGGSTTSCRGAAGEPASELRWLACLTPTDELEIYDPRGDAWEPGPPLPAPLSGSALAAFEGKLYLFGGWDGQKAVASVYQFDPDRAEWLERTPMPTARAFAGAGVSFGRIYVFGGYDGEDALAVTEVYAPDQDGVGLAWSEGPPLPQPRYNMGVASLADIIHVVGGVGEGGAALPALEFPPQADGWQTFDVPVAQVWQGLGVVPLGTRLYLVGGGLEGEPSAQNLAYQAIYVVSLPVIRQDE
jgi:DNA-binding CsgD family transcriptional regulator